jgi:hypothetical protein
MTADTLPTESSIPNTLSQGQRSSVHTELQAIQTDYYNITDAEGTPLAALLVLMDRKQRPVRAELQLHDTTVETLAEQAYRQAYLLVQDRYRGEKDLPFNVVRTEYEHERMTIPLDPPLPQSDNPRWILPLVGALVALLLFVSLGWFLNEWLTGGDGAQQQAVTQSPAAVVVPPGATEQESQAPGESVSGQPAGDMALISQTNDLPVSRNAAPLSLGQRVRIVPGYQVALRTQPGASAGEVVGAMQAGMEATIINGPVWLEGTSDTIVWWFVRLEDGSEAWVAANTSELTLLEVVE